MLTGLGAATLMAAGITWIVAAGHAARLDDECPDKRCVEGTPGGDAYVAARDSERASGILAGVGAPVMASGVVLLLFTSAFRPTSAASVRAAPAIGVGFAGGTLEARF